MIRVRCAMMNLFSTTPLGILLATLLSGSLFSGCDFGGTTTEAGNPGLVVGFRQNGQPVPFAGTARFYAQGSNPDFYTPTPQDGTPSGPIIAPTISFGDIRDNTLGFEFPRAGASSHIRTIDGDFLAQAADYRASLPMLPIELEEDRYYPGATPGRIGLDPKRPFNIAFSWNDTLTAFVQGIAIDSAGEKYRGADGAILDTLWVDLKPPGSYAGTVDTAGLHDAPLVVFTPGSPFAARVHGNRFLLPSLPKAMIPVRLVTRSGSVFAFPGLFDATRLESATWNDTLPMLVPGSRIDSLVLPAPIPVLDAPAATPAGPHKFTDSVSIILTAPANSTIFYTLDGSEPKLHSQRYTRPIVLLASGTLKAVAYRKGSNHSIVSLNSYELVPAAPKAEPASQAFRDSLTVSLTTSARNGVILYTMDGSTPLRGSPTYAGPIMIKATTVLKAVTSVPGMSLSEVAEERYILIPDTLAQD